MEKIKKFVVNNEEIEVTQEEAKKFVELLQEALEDWNNSLSTFQDFV